MKNQWLAVVMGLALVGMVSGCGKLSDAQQGDVANIVGGIGAANSHPSGTLSDTVSSIGNESGVVKVINQQIGGMIWLAKFKAPDLMGLTPYASSCPGQGTMTVSGATCTTNCPSASSLKIACSTSTSMTDTCNGTSYTWSNPSFSVTADVTNVSGSASPYTGTLGLSVGFSANVNGGSLDGKALSCTIGLSFDISKIDTNTAQTPTLDCSNFTCTYDNKNVDCNKVQADFGTGTKCS